MSEYEFFNTVGEQEEELINILIGSSLYGDMYPEEKQKLLSYLVSSYIKLADARTSGPFPR
jgi:hypothetical protein